MHGELEHFCLVQYWTSTRSLDPSFSTCEKGGMGSSVTTKPYAGDHEACMSKNHVEGVCNKEGSLLTEHPEWIHPTGCIVSKMLRIKKKPSI